MPKTAVVERQDVAAGALVYSRKLSDPQAKIGADTAKPEPRQVGLRLPWNVPADQGTAIGGVGYRRVEFQPQIVWSSIDERSRPEQQALFQVIQHDGWQ